MCRTDALSQKGSFRPQMSAKKGDDSNIKYCERSLKQKYEF